MKLSLTARLFRWAVRRYWPDLAQFIDNRPNMVLRFREMGEEIKDLKAKQEEWRQRCFSAEKVINYELRQGLATAVKRHNEEHGYSLNHYF